ncbi:MAG TPA: hypothetical protein VF650_08405 [Allosphingosinicella sp.]|jgi:hypothetical protein
MPLSFPVVEFGARALNFLGMQEDPMDVWPLWELANITNTSSSRYWINHFVRIAAEKGYVEIVDSIDNDPFVIRLTAAGVQLARLPFAELRDYISRIPEASDNDPMKEHATPESEHDLLIPQSEPRNESQPIPSSAWTGRPITIINSVLLSDSLRAVEQSIDTLEISNAEKAEARAYVVAMLALADAPDPPADLIWEMVCRASQISGIAALFVSIIAIFVR